MEPLWKMGTRRQAVDILVSCRGRIDELIAELSDKQLRTRTHIGGDAWSVKDLIGHLTSWETVALEVATKGEFPPGRFATADERNAAEIARRGRWTLDRIRKESASVRTALLHAIEQMDDELWTAKVPVSGGKKSARGLVIGKILVGAKFGLYAHDLAHLKDLERSVAALRR